MHFCRERVKKSRSTKEFPVPCDDFLFSALKLGKSGVETIRLERKFLRFLTVISNTRISVILNLKL